MYLKRITITGFKSFANKTVIELEPGITAVVGPNGSGKSNVADAIRWALGEQSKAKLRLGDREEVVFAGSEKRARASLAEVILVFDNSDGTFALEMSEIEIGRRLYRSGETEYRLAGRQVRLSEIQLLLAQAQVGAGSYAVVGQGMIDSMLMAGPAERKLLFDEASGIRGDELRREAATKRLSQTDANLTRLRDIRTELEPRLAGLERVAKAAERRRIIENQLGMERARLVVSADAFFIAERVRVDERLRRVAAETTDIEIVERSLNQALTEQAAKIQEVQGERVRLGHQVAEREAQRDEVIAAVARCQMSERELELARTAGVEASNEAKRLQVARRQLERRRRAVASELEGMQQAVKRSEKELDRLNQPVKTAQAVLVAISQQTDNGTQQQYITHALNIVKTVAHNLTTEEPPLDQVRLLVHRAGRLLSHAARNSEGDLLEQLSSAQRELERAMIRRESVTEHLANVTLSVRSLELDLVHYDTQLQAKQAEQTELSLRMEAAAVRVRDLVALVKQGSQLEAHLAAVTSDVTAARHNLAALSDSVTGDHDTVRLATELERARAAQRELVTAIARLDAESKQVVQDSERYARLAREWQVETRDVLPVAEPLPELERKLEVLEARLEAERTIQQEGEAEYTTVKDRHDELVTQIADLETAQTDLRTVVTRLDEAIRTSFEAGFASISEHFSRYFERLMGGGSAALKLERSETGEYGIEIKASPKGKRLSSISALSGGERSLTGVALLAAILATNPSPFIVLDEIDAALDEANSSRLASILAELNRHSQLIVITHNRQTMAAASVLFGVTLNDNHVSHLLSLRLEGARQLAAR